MKWKRPKRRETPGEDWELYVLLCEGDYIYVGVSTFVDHRIWKHNKGKGAVFTRNHKPVGLLKRVMLNTKRYDVAEVYENNQTVDIAKVFGHSNVRGGRYMDSRSLYERLELEKNLELSRSV